MASGNCRMESRKVGVAGDCVVLHRTQRKTDENKTKQLIARMMLKDESGFNNPRMGKNEFKNNPITIITNKLAPTEKSKVVCKLGSLILSNFKNRNPGMNAKKRKPNTCLAIKTSLAIEIIVNNWNTKIIAILYFETGIKSGQSLFVGLS
jgi:ABC-type antimicrobial peptide transport system ATPase subunit